MADHLTGPLMVSLLVPLRLITSHQTHGYRTIGSQLTTLSFDAVRFDGSLYPTLLQAAKQIPKSRLLPLSASFLKLGSRR
jgi:hypothetical protein